MPNDASMQAAYEIEARLRAVFDAAIDAIITIDDRGIVRSMNGSAERMFGYPAAEILGQNIRVLMPEPYSSEHDGYIARYLATGEKHIIGVGREAVARRKDGSTFPIELAVCEGVVGSPHRFTGIVRDVTARKRAEENQDRLRRELESTLAHLQLLMANLPLSCLVIDPEFRVTEWNPASERLFGYCREEAIGRTPLETIIPPAGHERVGELWERVNSTNKPLIVLLENCTRDGRTLLCEWFATPLVDGDGRKLGVLAMGLDVTEREQAAARIREQAALLDKVTNAIVVCDRGDRITYWNHAAEVMSGRASGDAVGQPLEGVFGPSPPDALSSPSWNGELRLPKPDGTFVAVESHWTSFRDPSGEPDGRIIINIDITEKKELEAKFLRAQRLESIGTLVSGIAHDLNNVMMPILMAVRLLKKDIHDGRKREMLDTAEASVERGTAMIRQLLTFAGGVEGERRPVVIGDLVNEVRAMLDHSLPKSIHLVTELPPRPWTVLGDATQLSQVLLNLCVNSRDAMPAGGTLTIRIDHRMMNGNLTSLYPEAKPGAYILLSVTDTGIGIPEHVKDRIFDPFFTTKPQGQGTGLGLSTVVGIVKSHGGFVNLYSEEGRGTKMTVYLPAHDAPATSQPEASHPPSGATGELILLIDDESAIRSMTRAALEDHGFRVITAAEGGEGLILFRQNSGTIRAVVVDMMMPGVDGPQVMAELRRDWPTVPIVAASGLKPTGATARAIEEFASTFLLKPYSDDDLVRTLNQLLGGARTLQ
ncbi:MAG: PAS domain S-box protein [Gemmataceae bacterium]|nr:PAS domain S-box protein [Gemmataceae bacterium]